MISDGRHGPRRGWTAISPSRSGTASSSRRWKAEKTSAEEAIEAIAVDPPELILLDLKLPGITGLELIRKLKESPTTRDIPIVVMTAFPEWFEKNKTLAAGCDAYFVKPLNTRTLSQQVAEVVARKAQGE